MNNALLNAFGSPLTRVEKGLESLRAGSGILVTDNEREGE